MLPIISNQKSKIGFYFHIPFCPHICPYCDFTKTSRFSKKDIDAYFKALYRSLDFMMEQFTNNLFVQNSTHCTVYFGGGTPSLFDAKFYAPILERLSKNFILEEATIETNPFTNKQNFIVGYRDIGINRVTLGAQSLCDNTLKILGRKHTKQTILNNIEWLREASINQIQVDLIYGLKSERTMPIEEEIKTIIAAGGTGISAYGLTLESRTVFGKSTHQIIDENKAIQEYEMILNICTKLGLRQIETSNFSFFDAKHNQLYWYGYPYFGIGTGAHGLLPPSERISMNNENASSLPTDRYGIRYKVGLPIQEYMPGNDILKFSKPQDLSQNFQLVFEPTRTRAHMIEELIFTLLRTENGIPLDWLTDIFNDMQRRSGADSQSGEIISHLLSQPQIQRAHHEGKIKMTKAYVSLIPEEKIRGDAWALIFIQHLL